MSAERATYLDSSAIVKLLVPEAESAALRRWLRRRKPLVSSALARTEVLRAVSPLGTAVVERVPDVLRIIDLVRVSDRLLEAAGHLRPAELRSLDAVHLATARSLGSDMGRLCTYDERMAAAAHDMGLSVVAPS